MQKPLRFLFVLLALITGAAAAGSWLLAVSAAGGKISGKVVNPQGALSGAHVRVRATDNIVFSDDEGQFTLTDLVEAAPLEITGWYSGHYVAAVVVTPSVEGVELKLRPYHQTDNPDYHWQSPIPGTGDKACGSCHPMILPQWQGNAHGQAITNPRFYSFYSGTDLSGAMTVEPGYSLDFPETAGSCANCHAPGASANGYLTTSMVDVRGVITAGIHCDYCHKVGGVYLDPASQAVYPNAPGVQSQKLLRPPAGEEIFLGPYDDIPDPDTYLPLIRESQFCAPCHQFSFWGTPIYESYSEWLASPYASEGVTCQDCHMPPNGDEYFADPEQGGLAHPPETIPSHLQLGASDDQLLTDTVVIGASVQDAYGRLRVAVSITNTKAGHHVPTDYPGRQMILQVDARTKSGQPLNLIAGSIIPEWGGEQAGSPGKVYAKLLKDIGSGHYPVVSYWKPSEILSDNRIPALASDVSSYIFQPPANGEEVTIEARVIFRRLGADDAQNKLWTSPDIPMGSAMLKHVSRPFEALFLPVVTFPNQ